MKNPNPKLDTTPALAKQVIDLYSEELADVRFPDLELSDLLSLQTDLHRAQVEVERVEAALADARAEVEGRMQTLTSKAERALSYARVFAQGNPELSPRIMDIGRKKSVSASAHQTMTENGAPAPRRGRRPKAEAPSELFSEAEVEPEAEAESDAEAAE